MEATLSRLRWQAQQGFERLGHPGLAALALFGACAVAATVVIWPQSRQAAELRESNAALQRQIARRGAGAPGAVVPTTAEQLASFAATFPSEREIGAALGRVQAIAKRHGLPLPQAEFRFVAQADDPLARYAMVLPVHADYRSLRGFVDDVLRELPGMALEEFSVKRDDTKSASLDARLRFVLFVLAPG